MFLLSGVRQFLKAPKEQQIYIYKQTKKKVNLVISSNAKVIHELIHVEFLTFASLMQWMPLTTYAVRIKIVRHVLTKAMTVRTFPLAILF